VKVGKKKQKVQKEKKSEKKKECTLAIYIILKKKITK